MNLFLPTAPVSRPSGRLAVVGPILFLLSDHAGYVTGRTLHVNGGTHMA